MPAFKNTADGDWLVDLVPLPKSHNQSVGLPVELSVNCTTNGEQPCITLLEKAACSCAFTLITNNVQMNKMQSCRMCLGFFKRMTLDLVTKTTKRVLGYRFAG